MLGTFHRADIDHFHRLILRILWCVRFWTPDNTALSVLELADLVHALEEAFGVSAAAAAAPAAAAAAAPVEEKTEFDVVMTEFGAEKIKVIKEVRGMLGLGLAEAKALVEGVPAKIKEAVSKEEAEEIKGKLEAVGAKVELK